nr:response regulator [Paracoccus saliphilus]
MTQPISPLDVLVVEDEFLIAMDLGMIIEDAGHRVIASAASLQDVEALPQDNRPDLALVDMQLARDTTGLQVNALIRERWPGTVVVFVTANPKKIPEDFEGAHGLIAKPFTSLGVTAALTYLERVMHKVGPAPAAPGSLVTAPALAALRV